MEEILHILLDIDPTYSTSPQTPNLVWHLKYCAKFDFTCLQDMSRWEFLLGGFKQQRVAPEALSNLNHSLPPEGAEKVWKLSVVKSPQEGWGQTPIFSLGFIALFEGLVIDDDDDDDDDDDH